MVDFLKFNIFNQPEEEINVYSFISFPLFCFRLVFFDFEYLQNTESLKRKCVHFARKSGAVIFILLLVLAALSYFGYAIVNSADLVATSSSLLDVFTTVVIITKGSINFGRRDDIVKLFDEFKEIFERRGKRNREFGVKKYLDNYQFYMKIYAFSSVMIFLPVFLLFVPFVLRGEMGMVVNYWFPFDAFTYKIYPIFLVFSDLAGWSIVVYALATDSMLYSFLTIVGMEFDILSEDLMKFSHAPKHVRMKLMKDLTDRHNQLLNIGDKLQDIYSITIFLSFCVSSLNLCFIAFRLVIVEATLSVYAFYIPYMGITCGQIFYLCIFGQKLIDASESVANGMYFSEWETFEDNNLKKQFIIVMARAQRPKLLTALGFAEISLTTFTTVS